MAVSTEDYMRVYRMVLMKLPKEKSFIPLTDELNAVWDKLEKEIDPNMGYDIPNEWPDPSEKVEQVSPQDEAAQKLRKVSGK